MTFTEIYEAVTPTTYKDFWTATEKRKVVAEATREGANVGSLLWAMGLHPNDWTDEQRRAIAAKLGILP